PNAKMAAVKAWRATRPVRGGGSPGATRPSPPGRARSSAFPLSCGPGRQRLLHAEGVGPVLVIGDATLESLIARRAVELDRRGVVRAHLQPHPRGAAPARRRFG